MFSSLKIKHITGVMISHIKKKSTNLITINLFDVFSSYLWCCNHHWYDFFGDYVTIETTCTQGYVTALTILVTVKLQIKLQIQIKKSNSN